MTTMVEECGKRSAYCCVDRQTGCIPLNDQTMLKAINTSAVVDSAAAILEGR